MVMSARTERAAVVWSIHERAAGVSFEKLS